MNTVHVLISYLFMVHFLATYYIHLSPIVTASVAPPPVYSTAPERYSDWNLIWTTTIYLKRQHPPALLCRAASATISGGGGHLVELSVQVGCCDLRIPVTDSSPYGYPNTVVTIYATTPRDLIYTGLTPFTRYCERRS
jgi:hypothetical protein